jgi:hypothetical protein
VRVFAFLPHRRFAYPLSSLAQRALLDVAMDAAIGQTLQRMRREGPLACGECLSAALARTLATDVFPVLQAEYRRPRSEQNLTLDYLRVASSCAFRHSGKAD